MGFATTELRLLLMTMASDVSSISEINLKLYVDDCTISSTDWMPHRLAWRVAKATDLAVQHLTDLQLVVSKGAKGKSTVVASNDALRKTILQLSKSRVLKAAKTAKLLGVG